MKFKIGSIYFYITRYRMKRRGRNDDVSRNHRHKLMRLKHQRYKKNGGCCELCDKPTSEDQLEIHHILPVSERPELVASKHNIMIVCHRCHQHLHGK
jgi:5-methylcytosine-specific restriction endonuclease McrA